MDTQEVHIMVDAHVHIHAHFQLNRLFLISLQNFRKTLNQFQIHEPFESFLFLTESAGVNQFDNLAAMIDADIVENDFTISATGEEHTLKVTTGGGQHLYVVSGKQIVTAEKLEVLALGYNKDYPDGRPLNYVIEDLAETGCLRVIPWGAGKWLGSRGKLISSLIASWDNGPIFLGDNGNRPSFWSLPAVFDQALAKNIHNLPGSDPLPFSEQEKKAGNYGFMLRGHMDYQKPFQSLMAQIIAAPQAAIPFGTPESFTPFMKNQISMQLVKRCR